MCRFTGAHKGLQLPEVADFLIDLLSAKIRFSVKLCGCFFVTKSGDFEERGVRGSPCS